MRNMAGCSRWVPPHLHVATATAMAMALATVLTAGACSSGGDAVSSAAPTTHPGASTTSPIPAARSGGLTLSGTPAAVELMDDAVDAFENGEPEVAAPLFARAARIDPTSVAAHLFATITNTEQPLDQRNATIDAIMTQAADLPGSERLLLQNRVAAVRFDVAAQLATAEQLVAAVPGSARAQLVFGEAALLDDRRADAVAAFHKALDLDPSYAAAYRALGDEALSDDRGPDAIDFYTRYTQLRPDRALPQNSLGDALMRAGRLDDAKQAFAAALSIDPQYALAIQGDAMVRLYAGDKDAAAEAMNRYTNVAPDRLGALIDLAYFDLALGDAAQSNEALDRAETLAHDPYWDILLATFRASLRVYAGRSDEATALLDPLSGAISALGLPASQRDGLEAQRLYILAQAQAALGETAAVDASAAALAAIAAASPDDKIRADQAAIGTYAAALAHGNPSAAVAALADCRTCRYLRYLAQRAAGDRAGAALTRDDLVSHYGRRGEDALIWSLLIAS